MGKEIYLDIDMDYFILPVQKAAVDNIRIFKDEDCHISPVAPVIDKLSQIGLKWDKKNVHCFTNHKKSYTYWWMDKTEGYTVIHVDAHSDLYRNSEKDLRLLPNNEIGCYNYLWYAIRDGYIDEIYWVIPDKLDDIIDMRNASDIINRALITETASDEYGLHISFTCIDINGREKQIMLHVCKAEGLPQMDARCKRVTIATSPEFIPEKADALIYELLGHFGTDEELKNNIYKQHKDMLLKTEEEVCEAKRRIGLK